MYGHMAHFVGEKLHIRPSEILDEWCAPELIVAYGIYANEMSQKHYMEWKALDAKTKASMPTPEEFVVRFIEV